MRERALRGLRWTARSLVILWAAGWALYGAATLLREGAGQAGIPMVAVHCLIFLVSALIPWAWEGVGGLLLAFEGLIVAVGYPLMTWSVFPLATILFVLLTMALPPLAAGALFMICWSRTGALSLLCRARAAARERP